MISNKDKHHVLISDTENITINVDSNLKKKKKNKELSGVNFKHLDSIKKADRKVNALSKIFPYMNFEKKQILMNMFLGHSSTFAL